MTSRDHIAQAKGMLMMRYDLSEDTAWQLLVRISQATNRKVRDVATAFKAHLLHQTPLPDDLSRQLAGQLSAAR